MTCEPWRAGIFFNAVTIGLVWSITSSQRVLEVSFIDTFNLDLEHQTTSVDGGCRLKDEAG